MRRKCVLYARVSTDEQTHGYSLQTQLDGCRKYAAERGYIVVAEFTDDYTGVSLDRPALNQMRTLISNDSINVVIVYDIDRLARKSVYQMLIEEEFLRAGATSEYVLGQYADTDEGRLQKQIRASIAEYEKAKILERSKRGKRGKAQSGFVIVGPRPPYGYCVKSEPHKTWLVIDEEEARIVRLVYEWYVRGDETGKRMSLRGIAKRLAEMRIPTRGDRVKHVAKKFEYAIWQSNMVSHILQNETYTGVWHYGKTQMISDGKELVRKVIPKRGQGKQVKRPREEWTSVQVPAIIDRETWQAAQARFEENKRALIGRPMEHTYLLSHRLRCAKCGYGFRGQIIRGKFLYYICNGTRQIKSRCNMPHIRGEQLEDQIWQWIKSVMQDPVHLAAGLRASQQEAERENAAVRERVSIIESQIAETQSQLNRLLDLFVSGEFSKEMLLERKTRLEDTLIELERTKAELNTHLLTAVLSDDQIAELEAFCAEVRTGLDNATFEDKRRYFDLLDVRGKLTIENNEKVAYLSCKLGKQRVVQMPTLHLSNTGAIAMPRSAFRSTIRSR
jgi:site-specific DNA recombinase